jgi:hypothetical protein
MGGPRYILVLKGVADRRFGIRRKMTVEKPNSSAWVFVVDDLDAGVELGDAGATCRPFLVDGAGEQHVLFAGTADFSAQKFTAVNGHWYPIRDGVWMSFPEPFRPGMVVEIAGLDGDGNELFRLLPPPLDPQRLEPLMGPGWKTFAEWGAPGGR